MEEIKQYEAEIRISTGQFEYINFKVNDAPEAIFELNRRLRALNREQTGISEKDYSGFIDRYLSGETNHVETYQAMSDKQKETVQIIKRSLARLKSREARLPKIN